MSTHARARTHTLVGHTEIRESNTHAGITVKCCQKVAFTIYSNFVPECDRERERENNLGVIISNGYYPSSTQRATC